MQPSYLVESSQEEFYNWIFEFEFCKCNKINIVTFIYVEKIFIFLRLGSFSSHKYMPLRSFSDTDIL